jgi:hypothetical protein
VTTTPRRAMMSDWQEGIKIGERLGRVKLAHEAAKDLEIEIESIDNAVTGDAKKEEVVAMLEELANNAHKLERMLGVSYE